VVDVFKGGGLSLICSLGKKDTSFSHPHDTYLLVKSNAPWQNAPVLETADIARTAPSVVSLSPLKPVKVNIPVLPFR